MRQYRLALIGFGNVNRSLLHLLERKRSELKARYQIGFLVTGVYSRRLGFLADANGLDVARLLEGTALAPTCPDLETWLTSSRANLLFEASSLEPYTGQPAIEYISAALRHGLHVVTANKGPIVHAAAELEALAVSHGKLLRFEATFMGGSPIYSVLRECLPGAQLLAFRGLPNATTTMILETIEQGGSFNDGVRRAQDYGIAETDPSFDVDGWDSAMKILGLANTVMGAKLGIDDVQRRGIRDLAPEDIRAAQAAGRPIRLVASLTREGDSVRASVKPERLEPGDVLATSRGSDMMGRFEFDVLPAIEIITRNSGAMETAYDMLADFVNIARAAEVKRSN